MWYYLCSHVGRKGASGNTIKENPKAHIVAAKIPDGMGSGSSNPWFTSSTSSYYTVSSKCEHPGAFDQADEHQCGHPV